MSKPKLDYTGLRTSKTAVVKWLAGMPVELLLREENRAMKHGQEVHEAMDKRMRRFVKGAQP